MQSLLFELVHIFSRWHNSMDNESREKFWKEPFEWINSLSLEKDDSILLVGHSLQGALAQTLAYHLESNGYNNIAAIGLASPGTVYSSKLFDIDDKQSSTSFSGKCSAQNLNFS